jgi:UDP-N-acetylmuramoylalanine--D-glutamate ligase
MITSYDADDEDITEWLKNNKTKAKLTFHSTKRTFIQNNKMEVNINQDEF